MASFSRFLQEAFHDKLFVLDPTIPISKYVPIDLSFNNKLLDRVDVSSSASLSQFIESQIRINNGLVGFGGYNERRSIYRRSGHFNEANANDQKERNIHLGVDLWAKVNTPIIAPLNATLHSFNNNQNYGDYGPTIILEHAMKGCLFYTLYGHLSLKSIDGLEVGQVFKQGDQIGTLGDAKVNGDYPPHLHFQIIKDLQGYHGDYPGVCSQDHLSFYLDNCPNPNVMLKL